MKCPYCGKEELKKVKREMPYIYKGEQTLIKAVRGDFCPACDEVVLDNSESERTSELMLKFNKEVNSAYIYPAFITQVRKKLQLD